MQTGMPRCSIRAAGMKPSARSASVVGHAQTVVPLCASRSSSAPSACVAWTTVTCGPQAAGALEQLDRPAAVLGEALLDLPRLLVGVDVEREALGCGVTTELLEPVARTGADGVGGKADADTLGTERLELAEVVGGRLLPHARQAAAPIRREQDDELDPGLDGGLDRRARLGEAEVVELADRGVTAVAHLDVRGRVELADARRRLALRLGEHQLPPRPEVAAAGPAAKGPLEGVAVRVDEARQRERLGHVGEPRSPASLRPRGAVSSCHGLPRRSGTARAASERAHGPAVGADPAVRRR